jgi:hypothetical protein
VNRYLAINIEGKIGQPTVIRISSFITPRPPLNYLTFQYFTSSFKQVACLILKPKNVNRIAKISLGSEPSFIDDFKKAKKGLVKNHSARTKVWS